MSTMTTIRLPGLVSVVGGRRRATQLLAKAKQPIEGACVWVDCRRLESGSPSFAEQLVLDVLVEGAARQLVIWGARDEFKGFVKKYAANEHVLDDVKFPSTEEGLKLLGDAGRP